jgi:hypothetical protein
MAAVEQVVVRKVHHHLPLTRFAPNWDDLQTVDAVPKVSR